MRLLYTSDLHGNISAYEQLFSLAVERQAEAVVVGGDLLPHTMTRSTAIARQRTFITEALRPLVADFRRAHPSVMLYLLPGNDDWAAAIAALDDLESEGLVHQLHERIYTLKPPDTTLASVGLFLAGYGCVPITPFSIKDYERRDDGPPPRYSFEMAFISHPSLPEPRRVSLPAIASRPSITDDLAALGRRSPPGQTIYVCHTPPRDTGIDRAHGGRHIGSIALRRFIEQHQPPLTLHGHVHEAPAASGRYAERIGATWCLNPGHDGRRLHAISLDTDDIAGSLWHTVYGAGGESAEMRGQR